jgi:hypothetical protein
MLNQEILTADCAEDGGQTRFLILTGPASLPEFAMEMTRLPGREVISIRVIRLIRGWL